MTGKLYKILTCCLLLITYSTFAQNIELSDQLKKSIDKNLETQLLPALDSLVIQIIRNNVRNNLIWKKEAKFTKATFEEVYHDAFSDQDLLSKKSTALLNCYPVGEGRYLCQLAFFKQSDDKSKFLEILLSVLAHTEDEKITFSTPLSYYTKAWKEKKVGTITYYYRDKLRLDRAEIFSQKNILFASRFKLQSQLFSFYMVENYQEIRRLKGFDYNFKSIGRLRDGDGVVADEFIFSVMNNEDFSHDLFHYYSGKTHDSSIRNWVTEEGLAYSWGNAYYTRKDGEMSEQKELLNILKHFLFQNKGIDLLKLFENNFWSDKSGIYEHLAPDFQVGRVISSLICDEVMRKHNMDGINELITCGFKPNQFDPFFDVTDKLIGLNRKNFNKKVRLWIKKIQ